MDNRNIDWEKYDPDVYIERKDVDGQNVLKQLDTWADRLAVEKNVWTIVAPPGTGKTWLLEAAQRKWKPPAEDSPLPLERLVVQIDVPRLINRGEEDVADRILDLKAVLDWLAPIVDKAHKICSKVLPFDRDVDPSATIDAMVAALCELCHLKFPPIVIVDRYDEVTKAQAGAISERILERFVSKTCIHMLIARRSDFPLQGYALKNPHVIRLQAIESVAEQFKKFAKEYYPKATHLGLNNLDAFMKLRLSYRWDHPYINAFLFNCALSKPNTPFDQLITRKDIEQCCRNLVNRPDPATGLLRHLMTSEFDCLKQIAQRLDDEWTSSDFEIKLELKLTDAQVDVLFKRGLIFNVERTQRYKVADGLRELLREL